MSLHFFFEWIKAMRRDSSQGDKEGGALISRRLKELLEVPPIRPVERPSAQSQCEEDNPTNRDKFGT
jgi:hypothetical protein